MENAAALIQDYVPQETLPVLAGCVTFGSTLAMSTMMQKLIGISTGTKMIPSVLGMATVCVASLASQEAAICNHEWAQTRIYNNHNNKHQRKKHLRTSTLATSNNFNDLFHRREQPYRNVAGLSIPMHDLRVCIVGLLAFRLLGGRFWGISPSSYTQLGSFARWSIPCGESYATSTQRSMIEKMGTRWGCHTCGSRMMYERTRSFKFVGDHMPPKSVAAHMNQTWIRKWGLLKKVQFRFYPQCFNCSQMQGSILSKASSSFASSGSSRKMSSFLPSVMKASQLQQAGGGKVAHFHGLRFRINHLTGGVLAAATIVGATDREIHKGNQKRFEGWQYTADDWLQKNISPSWKASKDIVFGKK